MSLHTLLALAVLPPGEPAQLLEAVDAEVLLRSLRILGRLFPLLLRYHRRRRIRRDEDNDQNR